VAPLPFGTPISAADPISATDAVTPTGAITPPDEGFDELDEAWLRSRPGQKWAKAGDGVIPCWVADMDFPLARPVGDALVNLAAGADLGYPSPKGPALVEEKWTARMADRYDWAPERGQVKLVDDLVQAVQVLLYVATAPGDGVLVMTPAYPPFVSTIKEMGRRLVHVPAVATASGWAFDMDGARAGARECRAILLVNPHNPTGRMLSRPELAGVAELAESNDLLVISDEIHADLAMVDKAHIPFASLSRELERRTVTLYSASKSYNLGGMGCAVMHIGAPEVRRQLAYLPSHLLGRVGIAAVATTLASWAPEADAWLDRCLARLRANREAVGQWLDGAGGEAGARGAPPEATYLTWIDFRAAGLGDDPADWLLDEAKVMLSAGTGFGPGAAGFARLNFATTPPLLDEILGRITSALEQRPAAPLAPARPARPVAPIRRAQASPLGHVPAPGR
jgi:cysteine-S-conjugate beta-lyase